MTVPFVSLSWHSIVVWLLGLGVFFISLLLLQLSLYIRFRQIYRQKTYQKIVEHYRPLFFNWMMGERSDLPQPTSQNEWLFVLNLWNELFERVSGKARDHLKQAAETINFKDKARTMLRSHTDFHRLLATRTLGHLQDDSVEQELKDLTDAGIPLLSLHALKALMQTNPKVGIKQLMNYACSHHEQPLPYLISLCKQAPQETITDPLIEALKEASEDIQPRLIPLLVTADRAEARTFVRKSLESSHSPPVLNECLKILRKQGTPEDQPLAQKHLKHSDWRVRRQAVLALGSIGTSLSIEALKETLSDPVWAVRRSAGQMLQKLPSCDSSTLHRLLKEIADPTAKSILRHCLST